MTRFKPLARVGKEGYRRRASGAAGREAYAKKIPTEMLMRHQRNPQGPSPDIVGLKGVRLAYANETAEGVQMDEARIKDLTGGDMLRGRVPYGKADVVFPPTHKLVVVGNHKPIILDASHGMWRRIMLVPFTQTIPESQRDRSLLRKLKSEGPAILNWALQGLCRYLKSGLRTPSAIKAATAEYRDEQDVLGEFISDTCERDGDNREIKSALYNAYKHWCENNGHRPLSATSLTRKLKERGILLAKDKRTIIGLSVRASIRHQLGER